MATDRFVPQAQLIQELADVRNQLAAKDRQCQDLARELTLLKSKKLPESKERVRTACRKLSEHKQAEKELRQMSQFPKQNPNPVLRVAADGTLLFANEPARNWLITFGWQADQPLPVAIFEAVADAGGKNRASESEISNPAGITYWICAIQPTGESYINIYGIDVTERKHAQAALRESEERLRLFIEHAPASLAMFDREMRYLAVSRRWLVDYRLGDRDIIGQSHYEIFSEIPERWKAVHRRGMNGEIEQVDEDNFVRSDGTVQWLRWVVRPWYTAAGVVGGIVIFTEDITEQKKVEEILHRYELLAAHSRDIILFMNRDDGQILEANAAAVKAYGYSREKLLKFTIHDLRAVETRDLTADQMEVAYEQGIQFETVHRRKDGSTFPVEVSSQGAQIGESKKLISVVRDITERKRAEEAIEQSERRFRALTEKAGEIITVLDATGTITFSITGGNSALGYTVEELIGRNAFELAHPDDLPSLLNLFQEGLSQPGRIEQTEFRIRAKDGSWRWQFAVGTNLLDDPAVGGIVINSRDITERKKAEEALRENQTRLEAVFATIPHGILEYDTDLRLVRANAAALNAAGLTGLGSSRDQLVARLKVSDLEGNAVKTEDLPTSRALRGEMVAGGLFLITTAAGLERIVSIYAAPLFKDDKKIGVVALWDDVSERIQAEKALQESEAKYRNLFTNLTEEVHLWEIVRDDESGIKTWKLVDVNPPALNSWGRRSVEEIRGKTTDEIFGPGAKEHYMPVVQKIITEGTPYSFEDYFPNLDKHFRFTSVPLGNYFITTGTDITAMKKAQEELQRLNETLEKRVAERTKEAEARSRELQTLAVELIDAEERERRRVADLLHDDLQQILAAARMQLQAVCESLPPEPMLTNVMQLIEQSIGKSRHLSHELSPAVLYHVGLVAALQWLAKQMRNQFGLQVQLETDGAGHFESAPLKAFMFRAVQELLFNIVKHAGVKSARVVLAGTASSLTMTVSDDGLGFIPNILHSSTSTGGFGLMRLRERARYIGGSLTIGSVRGQGSQVTLTVPLRLPDAEETELTQADRPLSSKSRIRRSKDVGGIRVLFVDDHHVMRQGLIRLMSGQSDIHVVGEAANGREAIDRVRQLHPDVVVMDVSMPEMNGIEATRCIKAEFPKVRVIGLSMHDEEHIIRSMSEAGAEAFVSKTVASAELLKMIYDIAGRKQAITI